MKNPFKKKASPTGVVAVTVTPESSTVTGLFDNVQTARRVLHTFDFVRVDPDHLPLPVTERWEAPVGKSSAVVRLEVMPMVMLPY